MASGELTRTKRQLTATFLARAPSTLRPRLLLDISTVDLVRGITACVFAWRRSRLEERIMARAPDSIVCFSVRSGFDLLLWALRLPAGSEIAFSAITHPDMARIAEAHGMRAVPVDVDLETLAPRLDALERVLSNQTRVVIVAHLFGGRVDLGPIAALAKARGALLVEDCAQSLGDALPRPHPAVDVSLYSFGTIKTATAAGGALLWASDPALANRIRLTQSHWPTQIRLNHLRKLLKLFVLVQVGRPRLYALLARLAPDLDALVNNSVRAFPGDVLLAKIRRRPSAPLLWLLAHRLETFDGSRVRQRARFGERLLAAGPGLVVPGRAAVNRTHWVFPVLTEDPDALVARLRAGGFDAARATSGIGVVCPPENRPGLCPIEAERLVSSVVFLPAYPELSTGELERMLGILR